MRAFASCGRRRRVIGKAEHIADKSSLALPSPHSAASSGKLEHGSSTALAARWKIVKKAHLELFDDRTPSHTFRANQLRLWFSSFAYVPMEVLRRLGLAATYFAVATAGSIRTKLLKIGAALTMSVRRIRLAYESGSSAPSGVHELEGYGRARSRVNVMSRATWFRLS